MPHDLIINGVIHSGVTSIELLNTAGEKVAFYPGEPLPSYTNVLDTVGYTKGIYLSNGNESTDANAYTTGYIPVTDEATIYLKNITMPDEGSHGNRFALYDANKVSKGHINLMSNAGQDVEYDTSGNLVRFHFHSNGTRYIRLSAWLIDDTSIITVNEPIE